MCGGRGLGYTVSGRSAFLLIGRSAKCVVVLGVIVLCMCPVVSSRLWWLGVGVGFD